MNFFKKIINLFNVFDELQKANKKIELIEEKLRKAYIFTDISVLDAHGMDLDETSECLGGCVYSSVATPGKPKHCLKCGRSSDGLLSDIN